MKDKYDALKEVEDGKTKSQVAVKHGIPKKTLSTWLKNKDKIFEGTKKGSNSKRRRLRQGTFASLDQAMFKWLLFVRSRDVAVLALVFQTKATEFAEKMNVENFKASDGWLDRWKKRFSVSFKTVSGESNACTDEMVAPWEQTTLPTVLSKYDLNQIHNADEFGLFYRAEPNKSLHLTNENCVGGKHSKLRLTGLTAANAVGEKLPLFVIGKSKIPRCFKHIKHLPLGIVARRKVGWTAYYSRNGFVKLVDALPKKDEKLFCWLIIVQPTHPLIASYLLN